jgi:hypothetical protein
MVIVGKMDGARIIVLPEEHQVEIAGMPCVDDVVELRGKVYRVTNSTRVDEWHDITDEFCEVAGWELYQPPIQLEDVL